jgi:hypothetical protein
MRVMVFAKATGDSEAGVPPTAEAFAAMDRFTEELVAAGVLVAGAGLKRSSEVDGDRRTVIDGPFAETRELIAGFSIWQVQDMAEALEWARRCPNLAPGPSAIELWPFLEAEDLAEFLTPEELAAPRDGERGALGVA